MITHAITFCQPILQAIQITKLDITKALWLAFSIMDDLDTFYLEKGRSEGCSVTNRKWHATHLARSEEISKVALGEVEWKITDECSVRGCGGHRQFIA